MPHLKHYYESLIIKVILIFFIFFGLCSNCYSKQITVKGIQVCNSTIDDVIKILGPPIEEETNSKLGTITYTYKDGSMHKLLIWFDKKTKKVQTIGITKHQYEINGVRIGDSKGKVESILKVKADKYGFINDKKQGIIYRFKGGWLKSFILSCTL